MVAMAAPMRSSDAQMIMGMTLSASDTVTAGTCAVLRTIFQLSENSQVGGSDYFPVIFDGQYLHEDEITGKSQNTTDYETQSTLYFSYSQLLSFSSPSVSSCFL